MLRLPRPPWPPVRLSPSPWPAPPPLTRLPPICRYGFREISDVAADARPEAVHLLRRIDPPAATAATAVPNTSAAALFATAPLMHNNVGRNVLVAYACRHAAAVTAARFASDSSVVPHATSLAAATYLAVVGLRVPLVVVTSMWCTLSVDPSAAGSSESDGMSLLFTVRLPD
jgi:hypothetical protein